VDSAAGVDDDVVDAAVVLLNFNDCFSFLAGRGPLLLIMSN